MGKGDNQYIQTEFKQQQVQIKEYRWLIIDFHPGMIKKSPIFVLPTVTYSIAMMYRGSDLIMLFTFRRNPYGGFLSVTIKLLTFNFTSIINNTRKEIVYRDIREIKENRFEVILQVTHIYPVTRKLFDFELQQPLTIIKYLSSFYFSLEFHEVMIYVEDSAFPVHKIILASQSTVFKEIFEFDEKVNKRDTKILYITDIKKEVFTIILQYIYNKKFEIKDHIINNIISAAIKYKLHHLIILCRHILIQRVNIENVFDYLLIADKYDFDDLEKSCLQFISENRKIIRSKKEYEDLKKNPKIVEKLIDFLSK